MKKFVIGVLIVLVIFVVVLIFGRNVFARTIVVNGIKNACGLSVHIKSLDIGLPNVSITGLEIYNPSGFKDKLMADIPQISVGLDLPAFFKNKVHLTSLKLDVKQVNVNLNEQGKLNVNSLALLMPKPSGQKAPEVKIDELAIKIGTIAYKGSLPAVGEKSTEFNANIDKTLHDVTNPSSVAKDIVGDILSKIGISKFAQFDVKGGVKKAVDEATGAAGKAMEDVKDKLKGLFSK